MSKPVVLVNHLTKRYGTETAALQGVSFEVQEGEIFGILGPDGAGKSTLLKVLAGLEAPTSGNVRILGFSPAAPALRGRIAYMPQIFNLYSDLTVWENLQFFGRIFGQTGPQDWKRLLAIANLQDVRNRLAGKLSGGMQKKLVLITVLVSQPELLILDEPSTGVDPVSRREIWDLLFEFHQQGMTILIATSYTEEAERCDRLLILDRGQSAGVQRPQRLKATLEGRVWRVPTEGLQRRSDLQSAFILQRRGLWTRMILRPGVSISEARILLSYLPQRPIPESPTLEDVLIHIREAMS